MPPKHTEDPSAANNTIPDQSPFRSPKLVAELKSGAVVYGLEGLPEVGMKRSWLPLVKIPKYAKVADYAAHAGIIAQQQKVFEDLGTNGAHVVRFQHVIGKDPKTGIPSLLTVSDWVSGDNLEDAQRLPEEAFAEIDRTFIGILRHYQDTFNGPDTAIRWSDFRNSQIVYGNTDAEPVPHAYIVDVDPMARPWGDPQGTLSETNKRELRDKEFLSAIRTMMNAVVSVEAKNDKKLLLRGTRLMLKELLDAFVPTGDGQDQDKNKLLEEIESSKLFNV